MQLELASPLARRSFAAILVAAVACAGEGARAEAPGPRPPIVLVLDPCAAVDAQEVRRLVPIEMGAPLAAPSDAAADRPGTSDADAEHAATTRVSTTRVFVGCVVGSPQLVRLEVRDPESGRRVERVITLVGDSKTDQARLVAIVAVELVAASRSELREAPPPAPAAPAPEALAVAATPAPAPPPPRARWRALAEGSLRHVAGLPHLLPGGGVAASRAWPRGGAVSFVVGADALVEGAAEPTALGDVDALLASVGLDAGLRVEHSRFAWDTGVGARGGWARLAGRASSAASGPISARAQAAPWAGPLVAARATAAVGHGVALSLGGELGYVTSAVAGHVEGQPDVSVSGAWWNLVLGVGYAP